MKPLPITLLFFSLFLIAPTVGAYQICLNSTQRLYIDIFQVNGVDYTINGTEPCQYGCAGGDCLPRRDSGDSSSLAMLFIGMSFCLLYLGVNSSKETAPLQWIFIPMGILFMAGGLFFVSMLSVFSDPLNEALSGLMWVLIVMTIFLVAYVLIYIIFGAMNKLRPYSYNKDEKNKY